jgi:hypothetical protein
MMTKHKIISVVGILGIVFLLGRCQRPLRSGGTVFSGSNKLIPAVLPKNDKEQVSFNENTHTLTIQTLQSNGKTKTVKEFAYNPVISLTKDNKVVVNRHLMSVGVNPFLGGGYADTGRLFVGANVLSISRFSLGGAIGWTPDNRYTAIHPYFSLGYNVYSNTSINLCVNPLSELQAKGLELGGFVSVRL